MTFARGAELRFGPEAAATFTSTLVAGGAADWLEPSREEELATEVAEVDAEAQPEQPSDTDMPDVAAEGADASADASAAASGPREPEALLERRINGRSQRVEYLVRWRGQGDDAASWQPIDALPAALREAFDRAWRELRGRGRARR